MLLYDHGVPAGSTQIPGADLDVEYRAGTTYATQSRLLAETLVNNYGEYYDEYPAELNDYSTNTDDTPFHNYCPSISVRENRRTNEIAGVHPYYHTSQDVYGNYSEADFQMGFTAVKMTLGTVAELAGVRILSSNTPPVADPQSVNTAEDTALALTLTGSDADSDPLTFSVVDVPDHGSLSGTAPNLTYTPGTDYNGSDSFSFVANDGRDNSAPAVVGVTITPVNDAPVANPQSVVVSEDASLHITLSGSDVDGDPLTYILVGSTANGILNGTAPDLSYAPNPDYNGPDAFSFKVSDGIQESGIVNVIITVNPVNDLPAAVAQNIVTGEDTPLAITLTGSDIDNDPLTFSVVSQPLDGSLSGTLPDLIYTPDLNFNGVDSFTFTANDGSVTSAAAAINITVNPVNDTPVADSQSVSTSQDTPAAITLTGSDVDGDGLTYVVQAAPLHGSLNGQAPDLVYTPDPGYQGDDSFSFVSNDGQVDSPAAVVDIAVTRVNHAPTADAQICGHG